MTRRLGRALRQRQPSASLSLGQKVAAIFRKYGTNAHVFLPSIGVVNGMTAGNYLDSAGTTAATVDNPTGLVLDACGKVGPELVTNGDFSVDASWTKGTNWTISGGKANSSGSNAFAGISQNIATVIGKTYLVTVDVTYTSGALILRMGSGVNKGDINSGGSKRFIVTADGTSISIICSASGFEFVGSLDNVSVKEVTGIHATQGTTASKPILRYAGGKYSWEFDGTDFLSLASAPFQMEDDHCVIVGLTREADTALQGIFAGSISGNTLLAGLTYNSGVVSMQYRNDALTFFSQSLGTSVLNTPLVASLRNVSGSVSGRKNAGATSPSILPTGVFTVGGGSIGNASGSFNNMNGRIHAAIAIKGTVSDADLLTLEKWVGLLSGVQI